MRSFRQGTFLAALWLLFLGPAAASITYHDRLRIRDEVKSMFYHAYDSYMRHAFPADELRSLSCSGHDTLGGYYLTLVDSLDTLVVMGNFTEFEKQVTWLGENLNFDVDVNVSVFETNIRIVGGLLSAHLLITESNLVGMEPFKQRYDGSMLRLSLDMATRLLKAFDTPTGLPYGTVNLMKGVPEKETPIVCTACAGTFSLEFGLLSKLTGDQRFETAARNANRAIWKYRSKIELVGNHINSTDGRWTLRDSGVGASIDSYFEYLLKASIMFDDDEYLDLFEAAYRGIEKWLHKEDWYVQADMETGQITWATMSTLQAFWPGLQVLYGDYRAAAKTMRAFQMVWRTFGFTPEGFNLVHAKVENGQARYPLRPEMAESLYYLAQSSGDDTWYEYGVDIIWSIQNYTRTQCGFAVVEDVQTHKLGDQMESFFLAETLKYLYLLFDQDNFISVDRYIFNTEGHPFPMRYKFSYPNPRNAEYAAVKAALQNPPPPARKSCLEHTYLQQISSAASPLWLLAEGNRIKDRQQKLAQQQQQAAAAAAAQATEQAKAQSQQNAAPSMTQGDVPNQDASATASGAVPSQPPPNHHSVPMKIKEEPLILDLSKLQLKTEQANEEGVSLNEQMKRALLEQLKSMLGDSSVILEHADGEEFEEITDEFEDIHTEYEICEDCEELDQIDIMEISDDEQDIEEPETTLEIQHENPSESEKVGAESEELAAEEAVAPVEGEESAATTTSDEQ